MTAILARITLLFTLLTPPLWPTAPAGPVLPATLHYQAPVAGARYVNAQTTLGYRLEAALNPATLDETLFEVVGAVSGAHTGTAHVANDGRTALFAPDAPFTAGEVVSVTVQPGLTTLSGTVWAGTTYTFAVSSVGVAAAATYESIAAELSAPAEAAPAAETATSRTVDPHNYVTIPDDMPAYTVGGTLSATVTDTYAFNQFPFSLNPAVTPSWLLLTDSTGEPIYYKKLAVPGWAGFDFRQQPNGLLSYWNAVDQTYHLVDNTYTEVGTVQAGNGYLVDQHELQLLPNGEALLMVYDSQPIDMSQIITGGLVTATVIGLVVQSVDTTNGDVLFEWRSWDHFPITETTVSLTSTVVDYVHGNAIELDNDGNLLVSSRHLDEITKLNRDTAEVMWRLGGPHSDFTLEGDPEGGFYHQHDIRRLANGNLSLFDNHNAMPQTLSRGVVYALDEISHTATLVSQYRHTPEVIAFAMGSYRHYPDGSQIIGWGTGSTTMSEVTSAGDIRLEISLSPAYLNYRATRFQWVGAPDWPPTLVLTDTLGGGQSAAGVDQSLYFSWNGATEVDSYAIYGGQNLTTTQRLLTVPRTGFEDHVRLVDLLALAPGACVFQVLAQDAAEQPLAYTDPVYTKAAENCLTSVRYLPLVFSSAPAARWFTFGR